MRTATLLDRLQAALGTAYTLERELGGGGMSRVFLAEERALGRKVVVKALVPDEWTELSAERFAREIRLAAALQQANIVPLLTAGGADGLAYYTMPYVDGRSLRERLDAGPLPLGEAAGVLRDVARALAFAHAHGVVHRDVKPANVLLSGGTAVVTDFGIAKAVDRARVTSFGGTSGGPTATLTRDGMSVGTPSYMSPEQCAGDPAVDCRADVYAWGVLAYEVLAGRHPFAHRRTTLELITAHLVEPPAPLAGARPGIPDALAELVTRCLAKDPADRPEDAQVLARALDAALAGDASGESRATAAPTTPTVPSAAPPVREAPSVAVLPFANLGGSAEDEFFADGITEEIVSALAHVRGIRVAARTSCFAFKGKAADLREVAERLGVRTVLEGSVRRAASRVRVTTQLVSAADGLHLWNARFDREMSDIFAVQDEIARSIADTLGATLRGEGAGNGAAAALTPPAPTLRRGRTAGPANVEAYEEYLRGRLHLDQRSTDLAGAIACFERAAALDPSLSVAYSGLAHVFTWLALWYITPAAPAFAKVRDAAARALALDPDDAVALAARAITARWHDWDLDEAARLARRAVEIAPGLPLGHSVLTYVRIAAGDDEGAVVAAERSVQLDPLSAAARTDLADALRFAGRHEESRRVLEPALAREPGHILANLWMAYALECGGDPTAALPFARRAVEASARSPAPLAACARLLAGAGHRDEARAILAELAARGTGEHVASYLLAVAAVGLGDDAATLAHLERAVAARDPHVSQLHRDHYWAPLRGDPRFDALVAAVGIGRATGTPTR